MYCDHAGHAPPKLQARQCRPRVTKLQLQICSPPAPLILPRSPLRPCHADLLFFPLVRFPAFLRARVQAGLTLFWSLRLPLLQRAAPAALAAHVLDAQLGPRCGRPDFVFVDFCAGAGGPTPLVARTLNALPLRDRGERPNGRSNGAGPKAVAERSAGVRAGSVADGAVQPMRFILTDIAPHIEAWQRVARRSPFVGFVPAPVDATRAPVDLLERAKFWTDEQGFVGFDEVGPSRAKRASRRQIFRLFSLAFHHFPDGAAERVLADTLRTSGGFAIFELQGRDLGSLIVVALMLPALLLLTPFAFWDDGLHLLFTFLIPIIPLVLVFDGWISCLRTRTGYEVKVMIDKAIEEFGEEEAGQWKMQWGTEMHTWPLGPMEWFVATKVEDSTSSINYT